MKFHHDKLEIANVSSFQMEKLGAKRRGEFIKCLAAIEARPVREVADFPWSLFFFLSLDELACSTLCCLNVGVCHGWRWGCPGSVGRRWVWMEHAVVAGAPALSSGNLSLLLWEPCRKGGGSLIPLLLLLPGNLLKSMPCFPGEMNGYA